jgi:hypothetical protein
MDKDLRNRYRRDFMTEIIGDQPRKRSNTAKPAPLAPDTHTDVGVAGVAGSRYNFFKSALLRDVLICIALVVVGLLALNNTRSNSNVKSPQSKPQTLVASTAQKQPVSTNNTSTLGTNTSSVQPTQAPSATGNLPSNFHLNNDRQTSNGVTTYSISDNNNNTYNVVEEPVTATNTLDSFAKSLTNTETLTVPLGSAVIGASGSELLAGIQTSDNRLIIIGAPTTSLRSELEDLAKAFQ